MTESSFHYTVFTKPWKEKPLPELFAFVKGLGFEGVELPVRPGFQVPPDTVEKSLPAAATLAREQGLYIGSIAGPTDERTIAACAEAGVPIIRIMAPIPKEKSYYVAIADYQRQWDALVPLLDRHKVAVGLQNHCWRQVANAMQLIHAIGKYDPRHVCAIWDPAHNSLEGEQPDLAADILWSHLRLVNLKNCFWRCTSGPEAPVAQWQVYWTTGRCGRADWAWVARELKARSYQGDLCLTAEYTDHAAVERYIAEDITYAKGLFM
jgi:sugar phosphate isomerase/epimerase